MALNLVTALTTAINKIIKINTNKFDVSTFKKVYCTANSCSYTFTAGDSNYTINSHNIYLIGNYIRLTFYATRNEKIELNGNSSDNVTLGYFKITDSRIKDVRASTTCSWNTGPVQNYLLNVSDNTIEVRLCATPSATAARIMVVIPVAIDVTKY